MLELVCSCESSFVSRQCYAYYLLSACLEQEDVSRPSVAIAAVVVVILFLVMAYVAMMENA